MLMHISCCGNRLVWNVVMLCNPYFVVVILYTVIKCLCLQCDRLSYILHAIFNPL